MSVYYAFSDRAECIASEGVLKGVLWCEAQPKTQQGNSIYHLINFVKGALWPIHLVRYATRNDSESSFGDGTQGVSSRAPKQNEYVYLCGELMSDFRAGDRAAKKRMLSHFRNGIFGKDDQGAVLRMKALATDHYGHEPSQQELGEFSKESFRLAIPVCMNKPSLTVKEAFFIGAESVVPGFRSREPY